jgi:hypothetical protein
MVYTIFNFYNKLGLFNAEIIIKSPAETGLIKSTKNQIIHCRFP